MADQSRDPFPLTHTAFTQLLRHLPMPQRVEYRRRIGSITGYWAAYLQQKYGTGGALAVARRRMVESVRQGDHFRNHLWATIFRKIGG